MRFKKKTINSGGNSFLHRITLYLKDGSIKLHIIRDDDKDEPHSHPWDFSSFILFGGYIERNDKGTETRFRMFSVNRKKHHEKHSVRLFRVLGIKIPAVTIGRYSRKIELCSFCKSLGYCKENPPPAT